MRTIVNQTSRLSLLYLLLISSLILLPATLPAEMPAMQQSKDNDRRAQRPADPFEHGMAGNATMADGTDLGFVLVDAPNGERVGIGTARFPSSEKAVKYLRQRAAGASKIISDQPYKDASGKIVGQRVIAQFSKTAKAPEHHAVIWTSGPEWHMITAKSLETVLTQEKKFPNTN
jgi:hypothetical protein